VYSAIGAYNALHGHPELWEESSWALSQFDSQEDYIKRKLSTKMLDIEEDADGNERDEEGVQATIPRKVYDIIEEYMEQLIHEFGTVRGISVLHGLSTTCVNLFIINHARVFKIQRPEHTSSRSLFFLEE
jgi:hypothetical protein